MGEGTPNVVGTAQIDVIAKVDEEQFNAAINAFIANAKKTIEAELKLVGGTASSGAGSLAPASGKVKAADQGVDAHVTSVTGVNESVQKALTGEFKISIDKADLRRSFEAALLEPFRVKVIMDGIQGGGGGSPTSGPTALPAAFERTLSASTKLGDSLGHLHEQLSSVLAKSGRTFGSGESADAQTKLADIVRTLGTDVQKYVTFSQATTRSGAVRQVATGGSISDLLTEAGASPADIKATMTIAKTFMSQAAGGSGGSTPLSALISDNGNVFTAQQAAQQAQQAAPAAINPVVAAVQEARAAAVVAQAAVLERPAAAVVSPETRGEASVLVRRTLEEELRAAKLRTSSFPAGRTDERPGDPFGLGSKSQAFDYDPETGRLMTSAEIALRYQGQIPTPNSPTGRFSYAQLSRAASSGFFNYRAETVNDRGRGTGNFITYDPYAEDEETKRLIKGQIGNIPGGGRAKGLTPEEFMTKLFNASSSGAQSDRLVPIEDMTPPGGQAQELGSRTSDLFASRVISKILGPQAQAFERRIQAVKISAEKGKRSGNLTLSESNLQQQHQADEEYLDTYQKVMAARDDIYALENEGDLSPGRKRALSNLQKREGELTSQLTRLTERGANPAVVREAGMSPSERLEALRVRAASQSETNAASRERIAAGAAPTTTAEDQRNWDAANVVIAKLAGFHEDVRSGKLAVSRETLPPGYEVPEDRELTRGGFARQHIASIVDEFREGIGLPRQGRIEVPQDFKSTLGPVISAIFRDLVVEPSSGNPAVRGSTPESTRRSLAAVSFAEADRVLAEAAQFRSRKEVTPVTGQDVAVSQIEGETAKRIREIDSRRALLQKGEAARFAAAHGLASEDAADLLISDGPLPADSRYGPARANFRRSFAQSNAGQEFRALGDEKDIRTELAAQARQALRESKQAARDLILSASGQIPLQGPGLEGARTPPSLTGAETAAAIKAMSPERIKEILGITGSDFSLGLAGASEAQEQIRLGVAPGLTRADFDRREAAARGRAGIPEGGGLTGDKTREVTAATSFVAGLPPAGGGGSGGGTAAGGRGRFDFGNGPIHVIVDNVPLQVAFEGVTGGSGPGGTPTVGEAAIGRRRAASAQFGAFTSQAGLAQAQRHIDRLRGQGFNDTQIAAALKANGLGQQASLLLDTSGTGGVSNLNGLRRRLGLDPVLGNIASPEAQSADETRSRLSAESNAAQRRILSRGFQASVTDLLQAPFFEGQREAVNRFNREAAQYGTLLDKQAAAQANVRVATETHTAAIENGNKKLITAAELEVNRSKAIESQISSQVEQQRQLVEDRRAGLPGRGAALGNLAVGSVAGGAAVALGSIVFQLSSQILSAVQEGIATAVSPVLSRASGFQGVAAQTTLGLAGAIQGAGGDRGAAAAQFAPTGISAGNFGAIAPTLISRAEVEAGNKALSQQIDLLHAAESIINQQGGQPIDQGIFATTGGLFGTSVGGIASTQELFKNEVNANETVAPTPEFAVAGTGNGPGLTPLQVIQSRMDPSQLTAQAQADLKSALATSPTVTNQAEIDEANKRLTDRIDFFSGALEKGGASGLKFETRLNGVSEATAKAFASAADKAGLTQVGDAARGPNRVILTDDSGNPILDPSRLQSAFLSLNQGSTTPDPALLIQSQQRSIQAKVSIEDAQRNFTLNSVLPQQQAINLATNPIGDIAAPLKALGVKNLGDIPGLLKQINAETQTGLSDATSFVSGMLGSQPGAQFAASLQNAAKYGQEISRLQIGTQTEQAALSAAQYSYQIYQVNRSLADAKGLTGQITDENGRNLGVIERQQFVLQRQSQELGFQMTQRQINYQVALAGFVAPGVTSEERAARITEAEKEAAYAQKQLDIQKQLAGLQGRGFQISASRQVTDLTRQLGLLQRGREVSLDTAKAEAKIRALTVLQDRENKKVETFYSAAVARTGDVMDLSAQLVAATGQGLEKVATLAINAFTVTYKGIIAALNGITGGSTGTFDSRQNGSHGHARGVLMTTTGAYNMTVGEAGDETVAVLRNPRPATGLSPFGGGGAGINVGGITVIVPATTSRGDAEQLAKVITRLVEENLSRRLTLLGGHKALT